MAEAYRSSNPLHGLNPRGLIVQALDSAHSFRGIRDDWQAPEAEDVGRLLPRYHIERLIGRGGMGAVYKAWEPRLERYVAIKLFPAELAGDTQLVERFQREGCTLAKLKHSRIVTVHSLDQTSEGNLYFVMEYVDGTDLGRLLRTAPLSCANSLALTSQICEALKAAHHELIIHRDLKPANILIAKDGSAKLVDFGLARLLEPSLQEESTAVEANLSLHTPTAFTELSTTVGTQGYIAPGPADHRADIFALGTMLYEMLTGRLPETLSDRPSDIKETDPRLDEIVVKARQHEPNKRYQDVSEMKAAVDRVLATPETATSARNRNIRRLAIPTFLLLASTTGIFIDVKRKWDTHFSAKGDRVAPVLNHVEENARRPAGNVSAEIGFIDLFDKAHTGSWKHWAAGAARLEGGILTVLNQAPRRHWGLHWYSRAQFSDFILRLEFKADQIGADSGVFVRFPDPEMAGWKNGDGLEIAIFADPPQSNERTTGAVFGRRDPKALDWPMGEWNRLQITAIGQRYIVELNGVEVNDYTGNERTSGYVGLQSFTNGGIQFRRVRVKAL